MDPDSSRRLRALIPEKVLFVSERRPQNRKMSQCSGSWSGRVLIGETLMRAADKKAALAGLEAGHDKNQAVRPVPPGIFWPQIS